jgi:hypothetical protein
MKDKMLKSILIRFQSKHEFPKVLKEHILQKIIQAQYQEQRAKQFSRSFSSGLLMIIYSLIWLGICFMNWGTFAGLSSENWIYPTSIPMLFATFLALLLLSFLSPFIEKTSSVNRFSKA